MATIKLPGRSILDMDNRKIEGLPAATVNGDAVRYEQLLTAPELFLTGDTITYNINSAGTLTIGFKTNGDLIAFINEAQLPLSQGNGELTQTYTGNFIFTINGTTYTVSPSGGTTFNWVYNTDSGTILQFTGAVSLPVPPLNTVQPNDPLFVEGVLSTVIGRFPVSTLIPGTGLTFEVEEGLLRIDALAELGIAGATLPVTDLTNGRIFYLESHAGDDDAGWYVYRTATTGIPAGWHFAGVHYEAADIYPEIGADAGSTDHVEPFNLTAGFWLHNGQVWLYTSAGDISINSATDLYNNGPVAGDGTRRGGWQLWTEFVASKQDALPNLHYGGVWTNGGTTANPVYASETIDIIGIIGDQHVDHTFANIGAWQADTTTNFEVGQYVALTSSSTARYKITTQSTGYSATGFTEFAVGDEDVENLILATASDISRAGGRFPTTEAWQNNRFELKGQGGSHISVATTGVTDTTTNVTYNASIQAKQPTFIRIGFNMVFDSRTSVQDPINFTAFKPLMTGLSSDGTPDERNFAIESAQEEYEKHVTSQAYQTNQFGQRSQVASLQAQVTQIEEELSHGSGSGYTWVDEAIFETVFVTNRTNSSGTTDQTTILQPHFVDTTHVFTTYAVLTGTADSGLRNEWNGFTAPGVDVVVGIGPDDANLIAFQLVSSYYRDSTAAGLVELKLRMIEPDVVFPGSTSVEQV